MFENISKVNLVFCQGNTNKVMSLKDSSFNLNNYSKILLVNHLNIIMATLKESVALLAAIEDSQK